MRRLTVAVGLIMLVAGCGGPTGALFGTPTIAFRSARGVAAGAPKAEITKKLFEHLDADKNGALSLTEFEAPKLGHGAMGPRPNLLTALDTDKDGKVSRDEFKNGPGQAAGKADQAQGFFDKLDANKDGFIAADEFQAGRPQPGKAGAAFDPIARQDTDKDGKLSLDEFKAPPAQAADRAQAAFTRIDANKDGFVTADEWPKARPHPMRRPGFAWGPKKG